MIFTAGFPFNLIVIAFVLFGLYACTHQQHHGPQPAAQHVEGQR